jgi:hypothetical protein
MIQKNSAIKITKKEFHMFNDIQLLKLRELSWGTYQGFIDKYGPTNSVTKKAHEAISRIDKEIEDRSLRMPSNDPSGTR